MQAWAEHFAETREWSCAFRHGTLISLIYRHYRTTRKPGAAEGSFIATRTLDRIIVAEIKDGEPLGLGADLKNDYESLMAKVRGFMNRHK